LLVLGGLVGAFVVPAIGFICGGALLALALAYSAPVMRPALRLLLRVSNDRPVATAFKLTFVCLLGGLILLCGFLASKVHEEVRLVAERQAAANAEKARVEHEANAKVDGLVADARRLLLANDVSNATGKIEGALKVASASNKSEARRLHDAVTLSQDSSALRTRLLGMSDADFALLTSNRGIPPSLDLGFPVLNDAALNAARPLLTAVTTERAANIKRKSEEEALRRKQEAARAEAEREERERQVADDQAKRDAAQREVKEKLNAYMKVIELHEMAAKLVESVSVERDGDRWTATITVTNLWHIRDKQLRLQDGQNLWKLWAVLTSKNEPDKSRIKLVDLNGNEVGGSRILGGSLIWVQD